MNGRERRREQVFKKINGRGEGLKEDDRKMDVEGWAMDLEVVGGVCEENRRI